MKLRADWAKMGQTLYNLFDNAIKFSPHAGEVVFSCEELADGICFSIQDHGIGIASEFQGVIFESFRQVDGGTTRKYGGVGLGLSVAKSLVELHGGKIWFDSNPGKGSTFHVRLPHQPRSSAGL